MTGRISLDADAMDGACRQLRSISDALEKIEPRLVPELTRGLPNVMKADFARDIALIRKGVHVQSVSSGRQAVELRNRASLTRLAAGEGTPRDVAILLSLCAGPRAIDPKKRAKLYGAIVTLQNAAFSGPVLGSGGPRKPNAVDRAMTRWAQWMGRGALEKKPFGSGSLTRLRATVLGQPYAQLTGPLTLTNVPAGLLSPITNPAPDAVSPEAPAPTPSPAQVPPLVTPAATPAALSAARGELPTGRPPQLLTSPAQTRTPRDA